MTPRRAAIYVRVSTTGKVRLGEQAVYIQNPDMQEQALRDMARHRGWEVQHVYCDRASGANDQRLGLRKLMTDARRGQFEVVLVWRFDRFARSTKQLVDALEEFRQLNINFVSHQEAVDTTTAAGRLLFQVIASMAEFERHIIQERVVAGLDYARNKGTKSGKPIGRPRKVLRRDLVVDLRRRGMSWSAIAHAVGSRPSTVRNVYLDATGRTPSTQACENPIQEPV